MIILLLIIVEMFVIQQTPLECTSYMNLPAAPETLLQKSNQKVFALVLVWKFF